MKAIKLVRKIVPDRLLMKMYDIYRVPINMYKYGTTDMFRSIAIELHTTCNRKCTYCPVSLYQHPHAEMSDEVFDMIMLNLHNIDYDGIVYLHRYDEPLLYPWLTQRVFQLKKYVPKCFIRVLTNGDYMTASLTDALVDAGVDNFNVTLHGLNQQGRLLDMKDRLSMFDDYINYTLGDDLNLSTRAGLITEGVVPAIKKCIEPLTCMQIDVNGNVILCYDDYYKEHKFGSIIHYDIMTLWLGDRFVQIRKDLRKGKIDLSLCRRCLDV